MQILYPFKDTLGIHSHCRREADVFLSKALTNYFTAGVTMYFWIMWSKPNRALAMGEGWTVGAHELLAYNEFTDDIQRFNFRSSRQASQVVIVNETAGIYVN